MSKIVSGKEVNAEALGKINEHENNNSKTVKRKTVSSKCKPKVSTKKAKICRKEKDPKPGPSCVNLLSEGQSDSDTSCDTQTECCVCNKDHPEEIKNCRSVVIVKWAQYDGMTNGYPCMHWTHLAYCTPVKVIRKGDNFFLSPLPK